MLTIFSYVVDCRVMKVADQWVTTMSLIESFLRRKMKVKPARSCACACVRVRVYHWYHWREIGCIGGGLEVRGRMKVSSQDHFGGISSNLIMILSFLALQLHFS